MAKKPLDLDAAIRDKLASNPPDDTKVVLKATAFTLDGVEFTTATSIPGLLLMRIGAVAGAEEVEAEHMAAIVDMIEHLVPPTQRRAFLRAVAKLEMEQLNVLLEILGPAVLGRPTEQPSP
jgi:hypothetical protein